MLTGSLDQIGILGGINDHVEGGFHRYSTERTWTVPHFEKMLYDNGQLLETYARAFALTHNEAYKRCALETAEFIKNRLTSPDGVFYASLDADSEGSEGRTYVWTNQEAAAALSGVANAALFQEIFGLTGPANFEEKFHILRMDKSLSEWARAKNVDEFELLARLAAPSGGSTFDKGSAALFALQPEFGRLESADKLERFDDCRPGHRRQVPRRTQSHRPGGESRRSTPRWRAHRVGVV